jgi:hypothetical protein
MKLIKTVRHSSSYEKNDNQMLWTVPYEEEDSVKVYGKNSYYFLIDADKYYDTDTDPLDLFHAEKYPVLEDISKYKDQYFALEKMGYDGIYGFDTGPMVESYIKFHRDIDPIN